MANMINIYDTKEKSHKKCTKDMIPPHTTFSVKERRDNNKSGLNTTVKSQITAPYTMFNPAGKMFQTYNKATDIFSLSDPMV